MDAFAARASHGSGLVDRLLLHRVAPTVVPGRYRQPTPAHIYSQFANVSLSPTPGLGGFVTWECNNQPVLTLGDLQVYGCTLDAAAQPDDETADLADRGETPYAGWTSP